MVGLAVDRPNAIQQQLSTRGMSALGHKRTFLAARGPLCPRKRTSGRGLVSVRRYPKTSSQRPFFIKLAALWIWGWISC
jgi:hypothetical protein